MPPLDRILDANINRVGEALRTIEDFARFALNDAGLALRLKKARHNLAAAVSSLALANLPSPLFSRNTPGDVGVSLKTDQELARPDALAVVAAAFHRAGEGLRVLGEFSKISRPAAASAFEALRYEVYALEPLAMASRQRKEKLASARLYVLITGDLCSTDPVTAAREAISGGADIIQMREKNLEDRDFHALAEKLATLCRQSGVLFLLNDRPHIAQLVGADGVHGGQGDLPAGAMRTFVGFDGIVGRSTSAPEYAEKALAEGADYIGVGPVYETNTKQHRQAVGLAYVSWIAAWAKLPYFCIGSINRSTLDGVLDAGAKAVAICTAITKAQDIAAEAAYYKKRVTERIGS